MAKIDITGGLFCLSNQHHWEENMYEEFKKEGRIFCTIVERCDNCGSDRISTYDLNGRLVKTRSIMPSDELKLAKRYKGEADSIFTSKEQYRAAYLHYRRQKAAQERVKAHSSRLRRVK